MKVCIVERRASIAPFDRPAAQCALGSSTLASQRDATLNALGLHARATCTATEQIVGPALVWSDDVWVTRRALKAYLKQASVRSSISRLALPPSRLLDLTLPLQDVPTDAGRAAFDVGFVPAGHSTTPEALFALPPEAWCTIDMRVRVLDVPVPRHILGREQPTMQWPLTSSVAMRVRHWLHVLRAGHLAPQVALLDHITSHWGFTLTRGLMSLRPTAEGRRAALVRNFVVHGRGVRIHNSATVEASVLEDNVVVGAHAFVRNSVVGAGSVIEQRAHVNGCALGPNTFVSLNSSLSACVSFGDTDACINGVQACVFGERGAYTSFALPLDLAASGSVRVDDNGTLRSVGELPCGVAFGTDVYVGARVVIAAGRSVAAGTRLYADPANVLHRIPPVGPGSYAVVNGTLAPLG